MSDNKFLNMLEQYIPTELQYLFDSKKNIDLFRKEVKDEMYFGNGYWFDKDKWVNITVPDANRSGHTWIFGTTRQGKTRLAENLIEDDIRKGYDVILLDPKGDVELFSKIVQIAFETGRQGDLMMLNPVYPEYSIKLNPLRYYAMKEELVGHVMAAIPDGKEPFFKNVGYEATMNVVTAVLRLAELHNSENKVITFNELKELTDKVSFEKLYSELASYKDPKTIDIANNIKKIADSDAQYYSKISSSLRVALMELSNGNIGDIVGKATENEMINRLEDNTYNNIGRHHPGRKGVIFVGQIGSLLSETAAITVGKVIISSLAKLAGRVFASGKKLSVPLCVYIDEAQSMLYKGIDDVFAKAGGAGLWMHCLSQSVNQIYDAMPSKDAAKAIMDNTNTKLFMRAPDAETARSVSEFFGKKKTYSPVINTNSGGMTIKSGTDNIIIPQHIQNLQPREFFMMTYSGYYRGMVRDVSEHLLDVEYPEARSNQ